MPMRYLTIPNAMTAVRALSAPVLAWLILIDSKLWALVVFGAALATDTDGSVARALNQESQFGATFDLVADGILFLGGILPLLFLGTVAWIPMLALLLVNIPRIVVAKRHRNRKGDYGSTFLSKATGIAAMLIIPLAILDAPVLAWYVWGTVIFTAAVIGHKTWVEFS